MSDMKMAQHVSDTDEFVPMMEQFPEQGERCCVCGSEVDYCSGHGEIGDPVGFEVLLKHEDDDHEDCHMLADCKFEDGAP